jgi:spermidine synthase
MSSWFEASYSPGTRLSLRITRWLCTRRSPYQTIDIFDTDDFGRVLALDGVINVTERDEFIYHEMLTHVPLFVHPRPGRVLVIGGGDGGTVREVLKHPCVEKVLLVEIDREVVAASREYLPALSCALGDPRVDIRYEDAVRFIARPDQAFDIIIIDSTDPAGPGAGLFTADFYRNCRAALAPGGILTAQSESPFFDAATVGQIYAAAGRVFGRPRMYTAFVPSYVSGVWSFLFCADHCNPAADFQSERYQACAAAFRYYSDAMHAAAFALPPWIKHQCAV